MTTIGKGILNKINNNTKFECKKHIYFKSLLGDIPYYKFKIKTKNNYEKVILVIS